MNKRCKFYASNSYGSEDMGRQSWSQKIWAKNEAEKTKSEKRNYIVTFYLLIEFTEFWHDDRGARGPQNVEKNRESEILVTRLNNF